MQLVKSSFAPTVRPHSVHRSGKRSVRQCAKLQCHCESRQHSGASKQLAQAAAGIAAAVLLSSASTAQANEKVAEFAASGLIFKDSVEVLAIQDPDVENVTIFISDFKRSLADKLQKDFFNEPSQASVTCAATGPVTIKNEKKVKVQNGQEVFTESKGLNLFQAKTLRVRRVYDADRNTLLYVSYSTRLSTASDDGGPSTGRYKTSICALPITPTLAAAAPASEAAVPVPAIPSPTAPSLQQPLVPAVGE